MEVGGRTFKQLVNYWHASFRCLICKGVGHIKVNYPLEVVSKHKSASRWDSQNVVLPRGVLVQEGLAIELISSDSSKEVDSKIRKDGIGPLQAPRTPNKGKINPRSMTYYVLSQLSSVDSLVSIESLLLLNFD